jgi:hypothetical protein
MSRIGICMNYFGRVEELDLEEESIRAVHRGEKAHFALRCCNALVSSSQHNYSL